MGVIGRAGVVERNKKERKGVTGERSREQRKEEGGEESPKAGARRQINSRKKIIN